MFIHRWRELIPLGVSVQFAHFQGCVRNIPALGGDTTGELTVLRDDHISRPRIAQHHQVGKPQPWATRRYTRRRISSRRAIGSVSLAYSCISGVA
jgi:hypothetical protein